MRYDMERSAYRLQRTDSDGIRWFRLICMFCYESDERGLPPLQSVGLYFSHPLMCPKCRKWSIYYKRANERKKDNATS